MFYTSSHADQSREISDVGPDTKLIVCRRSTDAPGIVPVKAGRWSGRRELRQKPFRMETCGCLGVNPGAISSQKHVLELGGDGVKMAASADVSDSGGSSPDAGQV
ncbi:hypothetical protein Bbelb_093470 [Branchiostoma belcheri]|nr:hypothetical protein Bbelb_093470 [Branchiostoma belcheri]